MTQQEFNARIVEHQVILYRFARSLAKNSDDADDLVQDTFLKALLHKDKFTDEGNLKAWLMTILKNLFISKYRRDRGRYFVLADTSEGSYFLNLTDKSDICPESLYNEKEIREVIDQIKPRFRDPFIMHFDGYKYEEIAERLDVPMGTIKSRIFFARKSIMDALSGKCALAPALVMSKDIIIEDNSLKFVKPMKEEILKFRTICENMIKAGITNKNKITLETLISWPTFKKITEWPIDKVHVEDDILAKIVSFTIRHSTFALAGREVDKVVVDDLKDNTIVDKEKMKEWIKPKLGRGKYIRKHEPKLKVEEDEFKSFVPDLKIDKEQRNYGAELKAIVDEEKDRIRKEIGEEFAKKEKDVLSAMLKGDEPFWFHLGKAMSLKPSNVKITINTD